jgi:hypothetical protein
MQQGVKFETVDDVRAYLADQRDRYQRASVAAGELIAVLDGCADLFEAHPAVHRESVGYQYGKPWDHISRRGIAANVADIIEHSLQGVTKCPHCAELFHAETIGGRDV